jgi:hypothetical protein
VFEPLICCLKGIWVHPHTIPLAKLAPDGNYGLFMGVKMMPLCHGWGCHPFQSASHIHIGCTIKSGWAHWYAFQRHRVIALCHYTSQIDSDLGILVHLRSVNDALGNVWGYHPTQLLPTFTKCLSLWYAVSRVCVHPHTIPPAKLAPNVLEFCVTWGVTIMPLHHVWGCHPSQMTSHIHIRYINSVWAFDMLSQGHMGAPLSHSIGQVGSKIWDFWFWVTWGVEMMPLCHGWGCHPILQSASHIHIRHIQSVWAFVMLSQRYMSAPLYHSTGQGGPQIWEF